MESSKHPDVPDSDSAAYVNMAMELNEDNNPTPEEDVDETRIEMSENGKAVILEPNNHQDQPQQRPPRRSQKSKGNEKKPAAVIKVRYGVKRYGSGGPLILNDFNMTVKQGTIYSLLGSSGCGKTTALTCILGMRHLQEGEILVFGKRPRSFGSRVPGNAVGYMPQDVALYGDFSIHETLMYYGTLFGMDEFDIDSRKKFLMSFLDMRDEHQRIKDLSGGQQRRASLAAALLHQPQLLILDEPTVGVDPLLREKIWQHLVDVVKQQGTTVVITTHYIEEARRSDTIGVMRGGKLLVENDPESLMTRHGATYLEDVVLKLCHEDREGSSRQVSFRYDTKRTKSMSEEEDIPCAESDEDKSEISGRSGLQRMTARLRALILKNFYVIWRNIFLVLFMILTPSLMILLICNGIGSDPQPLNFGVVNYEGNLSVCEEFSSWRKSENEGEEECDLEYLSCKFLDQLPKGVLSMTEYAYEEEAVEGVKRGDIWGYLQFPDKFSDNLYARASIGNRVDEESLDGSFVTYQLDMTSKQHSGFIKKTLGDTYELFIKTLLKNCGLNPKLGDSPIRDLEPIYGTNDPDFREYIAPSLLVGFLFFFPLCSSSIQFLVDKKQGTMERARVAGVHTSEIMAAYWVTEGMVLLVQTALSLGIVTGLYGFEVRGSMMLLVIVYLLMGIGGISAGFLLAAICNQEVEAVLLAMSIFFPNFLLSGLLWPIEGMPYLMQYGVYILPATFPAKAIRSIMSRGWGLSHSQVWPGIVAPIVWLGVYCLLTLLIHKLVLSRK